MAHILASEDVVEKQTQEHGSLSTSKKLISRAADTMLRLMYTLGPQAPADTPDGIYRLFAFERFLEAPYTVRAAALLADRGHYPEAIALLRVLIESFVQLRYFAGNKEPLKDHMLAETARNRVPFVAMFDAFAPGFYGKIYGRLLSGIAHSGMGLSALLPVEAPAEGELAKSLGRHGCTFEEKQAGFVVNVSVVMLLGFLTQFEQMFPGANVPDGLTATRSAVVSMLKEHVGWTIKGEMLPLFVALTGATPD